MASSQKQRAIELLSANPSKESLLNLISWLDLECSKAPLISLPQQILARAVVALGHVLNEKLDYETITHTIQAAERFALEPTIDNVRYIPKRGYEFIPFWTGRWLLFYCRNRIFWM